MDVLRSLYNSLYLDDQPAATQLVALQSNLPRPFDFLSLNEEIIVRILCLTDYRTVCSCSQTCTILHRISRDDLIWKTFLAKKKWLYQDLTMARCSKPLLWEDEEEFSSAYKYFVSVYSTMKNIKAGHYRELMLYHDAPTLSCAASAGWWVASGGKGGVVTAYKLNSLATEHDVRGFSLHRTYSEISSSFNFQSPVRALAVHPTGFVVAAFHDETGSRSMLVVWDAEMDTRQHVISLPVGSNTKQYLATEVYLTDTHLIVNCGPASNIMVWSWQCEKRPFLVHTNSGRLLKKSRKPKAPFKQIVTFIYKDRSYIVALRHHLHIWTTELEEPANDAPCKFSKIKSLTRHGGNVRTDPFCSISYSTGVLLAGTKDGCIHAWRIKDMFFRRLPILEGANSLVCSLAVCANHDFLACGKDDGTIEIWDLEMQLKLGTVSHDEPIQALRWHPSGKYLLSCSSTSKFESLYSIQLWKYALEQSISPACTIEVPAVKYLACNKFGILISGKHNHTCILNFHPQFIPGADMLATSPPALFDGVASCDSDDADCDHCAWSFHSEESSSSFDYMQRAAAKPSCWRKHGVLLYVILIFLLGGGVVGCLIWSITLHLSFPKHFIIAAGLVFVFAVLLTLLLLITSVCTRCRDGRRPSGYTELSVIV